MVGLPQEVREYQGVHSAEWRTQLSDSQQEASKLVDGISKIDLEMETTTQRVEELLRVGTPWRIPCLTVRTPALMSQCTRFLGGLSPVVFRGGPLSLLL